MDNGKLRILCYNDIDRTGCAVWGDLIARMRETDGKWKLLQVIALSTRIQPWPKRQKEQLLIIPSQGGATMLLCMWDESRGQIARSLRLLYPTMEEMITLDGAAGAAWIDMSFDGSWIAWVMKERATILSLDEMETRVVDTVRANTLSFLPDGMLLIRVVGRQATMINPATGEVFRKRSDNLAVPRRQPLNTRVETRWNTADGEQRVITIASRPNKINIPQERYIPMRKEDKVRFNEWFAMQNK